MGWEPAFKKYIGWLVAALLPLIGFIPTLGPGISRSVIDSADGPFQVHRIYTLAVMLADGQLWPRWVPYYHLGFGYPIFNFYPPGAAWLGGVLVLAGFSPAAAFNLIMLAAWMVGSVGMYVLARDFLPAPGSLLAAMLWSYAPSHLAEIWFQGGLAQAMAAACVPWFFHGLIQMAYHPTRRNVLVIALPLAGIALAHLPILYITAFFAAPAAVVIPLWAARHDFHSLPRRWLGVAAGLLLGAGLAAIMLLPMARELKYIRASEENSETISYLKTRFIPLYEVFSQPMPVDRTDLNPPAVRTLGLVGGLLGAAGMLALIRKKRKALALVLLAALAVTVFMLLEDSQDIWLAIPHFRQLRFPERFLRLGSVWLALAGGSSLLLLPERWQKGGLALGLILALGSALPLSYGTGKFTVMEHLTALDEINFEQATHIWGTTSYDEYDPIWGEQIPLPGEVPEPEQYISDPLRIVAYRLDVIKRFPDLKAEELDDHTLRVTLTQAAPVRFHQYYFPGWTARLDGKAVKVYPEPEMGLLTVDVPAGEHIVELCYQGTAAQRTGTGITLISLGIAGGLLLSGFMPAWRKKSREQTSSAPDPAPLSARVGLAVIGGIGLFILADRLYITPHTMWFRVESSPDNPAYMEQAVHQNFGDTFELLGYTLPQDEVRPGDKLAVTLYWRSQQTITEEYQPRVQLVNLSVSEAWASDELFFPQGGIGYTSGQFTSDQHTLRVSSTAPPYVGRLSVQLVRTSTGEALRLPDGSDRLLLDDPIRIEGDGHAVSNGLHYTLGQQAELRCASIVREGKLLDITLYWRVTHAPQADLTVLVHGLDADGNIIQQNDAPPLGLDYPSQLWQAGQNLVDHHLLPADPALRTVAVGLYSAEGRLSVLRSGQPVPDDQILLPITEQACADG